VLKDSSMRFITLQKGEGYRVIMSEKDDKNHSTPKVHKYFPFSNYDNSADALNAAKKYRDDVSKEHLFQRYGRDDLTDRLEGLASDQKALYEALMQKVITINEPGVTVRLTKRYKHQTNSYAVYLYARATWREENATGTKKTKYKDFRVEHSLQIDSQLELAIGYRKLQLNIK